MELLFGFFLAGSALAHAEPKLPHPVPVHGIGHGHGLLPDVPLVSDTVSSVQHAISPVTKAVAPVTNVVTSLTTNVTTTVVRTIQPVVQPAMSMTTPVLTPIIAPVLGPPATSRSTAPAVTPAVDPITDAPAAQPVSAQTPAVPTTMTAVRPPQVLPVDVLVVPADSSVVKLLPAPSPRVPFDGRSPIVDVTGGSSTYGSSPTGPTFGISRPFAGSSATRLTGTGVWPGAGPPKWWLFDPHHHPS